MLWHANYDQRTKTSHRWASEWIFSRSPTSPPRTSPNVSSACLQLSAASVTGAFRRRNPWFTPLRAELFEECGGRRHGALVFPSARRRTQHSKIQKSIYAHFYKWICLGAFNMQSVDEHTDQCVIKSQLMNFIILARLTAFFHSTRASPPRFVLALAVPPAPKRNYRLFLPF